jgi:hypothetical protein
MIDVGTVELIVVDENEDLARCQISEAPQALVPLYRYIPVY